MKRIMILVIIIALIGSFAACKKSPDQSTKKDITETSGPVNNEEEPTTSPGSVTKDVYAEGTTEELTDVLDYSTATGTVVTDELIKSDLQSFIEKFYFSYLFKPVSSDGILTESEMQLFAISYIYQFEHQELTFDASAFVLYIPEDKVSEVINRFFDYEFINHGLPVETNITYENGYYLMPARDDEFGSVPVITQILQISDFDYKVFFEESAENKYEAVVEDREGRYIMSYYKKIVAEPIVEVSPSPTPAP